jgi:hypothetical protein
MARQVTVTTEAADRKKGMTLGELEAFIAEARSADLGPDTQITVTTGWRSQIAKLATKS